MTINSPHIQSMLEDFKAKCEKLSTDELHVEHSKSEKMRDQMFQMKDDLSARVAMEEMRIVDNIIKSRA